MEIIYQMSKPHENEPNSRRYIKSLGKVEFDAAHANIYGAIDTASRRGHAIHFLNSILSRDK